MRTIVWDVDDVLNDLMRDWFENRWLGLHPNCSLRYEDIVENPPHRLLGVSVDEYLSSLDSFRLSGAWLQLTPVAEVLAWFREYGSRFRHVALTATPLSCANISAAWVTQHFGMWIRSFNFVPSSRPGQNVLTYDQNKAEFLRWWGRADVLVDDSPANVNAARDMDIQAILAPRPWNDGKGTIAEALRGLAETTD
ncbi:MAG: hypothetical protein Q7O66_18330 [Dehalococcoidia bacterium]|nr:hypothetical protein [Dehalococcoidia bacterium]